MKDLNKEKTDVVSVILDDHDLLGTFAEVLKTPTDEDFSLVQISANSIGRMQRVKFHLWERTKNILKILSNKAQVLAVLAEYHFKNEQRKLSQHLIKKD